MGRLKELKQKTEVSKKMKVEPIKKKVSADNLLSH